MKEDAVLMIGEVLLVLQKLERLLAALLLTMTEPDEVDATLRKALLRDRETLGRLVAHFKGRVDLPPAFAQTLDSLLSERNTFVHKLFMEPWFDLKTEEWLTRIAAFLAGIRAKAKVVLHVMMATSKTLSSRESHPNALAYVDAIVTRIGQTAAPDSGGLSEDEYVAKVVRDADALFPVRPLRAASDKD